MLEYTVPEDFLAATKMHHRCVQKAIATLANRSLNIDAPPRGISRHEGGVQINGQVIRIKRTTVLAQPTTVEPTREERAVVDAIGQVVSLWRTNKEAFLEEFCELDWVMCEPLRYFYSDDL